MSGLQRDHHTLLIVAGEQSGDRLGEELVRHLKHLHPDLSFWGTGGQGMRDAGVAIRYDIGELQVTGMTEVLRHLPFLRSAANRLVQEATLHPPVCAILIDFPGFNLRLARRLKQIGLPVCYVVAPQVWAWREYRTTLLKEVADHLIVLFPFELDYFSSRGIPTSYAGHPLVDSRQGRPQIKRTEVDSEEKKLVIGYVPGSRSGEVRRHLPLIRTAIELLGNEAFQHVVCRTPSIDRREYRLLESLPGVELVENTSTLFHHADIALVKSGTSTLEAMLEHVPFVCFYRSSWITEQIARRLARTNYICIVNILAGQLLVDECVGHRIEPPDLVRSLHCLIHDTGRRKRMIAEFGKIEQDLSGTNVVRTWARTISARFLQ